MKSPKLIRVTSVLSWIESAWKEYWFRSIGIEAADKISKESAEFGTRVHAIVGEFLINPIDQVDNSPEYKCAADILTWLDLHEVEPLFETWEKSLEIEVSDKKLGLIGHFDCVAVVDGKPCIIDFKTSNKMRKSFPLQKAAYAKMCNKQFGTKIDTGITIRAHWHGANQEVEFEIKQYDNLIKKYWPLFKSCLNIWMYFNRAGK